MKQKLLFVSFCLWSLAGFSQEMKVNYAAYVNQRLFDVGSTSTAPASLEDLQLQAGQGDAYCLNLLGLLYREGLIAEKNEDKAFELIHTAAQKEFPAAEFNTGRFYMIGLGCDIDFDQAIHWVTLAADHGNDRAAYALGYMYFKGFGVKQDYKKAVSWFELSPWSMAKHYLGICYYFGYGVEKNEDQAILYFSKSRTTNSDLFLKHIAENVKENVANSISKEISEKATPANTAIEKEAIEKTTAALTSTETPKIKKELKPKYFNGKWKGKLIELDWSGKEITNVLPLAIEFTGEEEDNIHYKLEINKTSTEQTALLNDNALYFEKQYMTFELPYSENPNSNFVTWQLLSSQMEFKTINKKTYLTGSLQTFSEEYKESGPPMQLILRQTEGDEELTKEEILALSAQKEHFITVYPNPFESDVLIEYELETDADVNVNVYDLSGNAAGITLEPGAVQTQGKHKYTLNGSSLRPGMYIVRVGVGGVMHSRILIKN